MLLFLKDDVRTGVVRAMLQDPDGTVQHARVVIGMGDGAALR